MNKNMKKKKQGFTLIELVIVLAVLAIIAMIAIPNFTRVRNESLIKADIRSAEQIEKITLMAIANNDIKLNNNEQIYEVPVGTSNPVPADATDLFRDVKKPQVPGAPTAFHIKITAAGEVNVGYGTKVTFNEVEMTNLAGKEKDATLVGK